MRIANLPGRGAHTAVISDQTIFERTQALGALELHGLEKASSALYSGQWSGQRQFQAHTSLIKGCFGPTLF